MMKKLIGTLTLSVFLLSACATSPLLDADRIIAEAEAADLAAMRAQNSGDLETFATYLSKDYAYIDLSGNRIDKADMLVRRSEDKRAILSEESSEDEAILLARDVVMFRGRTDTVASYYGGLPRPSSTRYSVIWRKETDGQWRMVAAQTTDRIRREYPVKVRSGVPAETLAYYAGSYALETQAPLTLKLEAAEGHLLASIEGQFDDMQFFPESETHFFATTRPFELRLAEDACSLVLVTFGAETPGKRIVD